MAGDVFDRLSVFVFVVLSCVLAGDKPNLFSPSDDVVILDSSNFNKLVHGSHTFWMIDFYNSWCGHCIHFAPTWKDFATDVKNWQSVVKIGAVDCSNDENVDLCRNKAIVHYPTVMYFPPDSALTYIGETFGKQRKIDIIRESLVQYMMQSNYPQVQMLQPVKSLESIWQPANTMIKHVIVLFLSKPSIVAQELILDMLPYKDILLRYMMKEDATSFGIKDFPSLYLIENDGKFVKLASGITERQQFLDALKKHFDLTSPVATPKNNKTNEAVEHPIGDQLQSTPVYHQVPEAVYYEDLLSAVTYSLLHEIATMKQIDGEGLQALKLYIQVLVKYLPASDNIVSFLRKIDDWLKSVNTSLEGIQWLKQLHDLQDSTSNIPSNTTYIGCHGSASRFRGYPCSMWVLFHTLTVNSVIEHGTDADFSPQEVLLAMRGYITNFFGCRECSVNFNKGAKFIEERVHKPDDGILYLWIMHNRANFRLHGDITEDPHHPKIQFPSRDLCLDCLVDDTLKDGKPNWDEVKVLEFLKKFYSSKNIRTKPESFEPDMNDHQVHIFKAKTNEILKQLNELDAWRKNDAQRKDDIKYLPDMKLASRIEQNQPHYNTEKTEKLRRHERDTRIERSRVDGSTDLTGLDLSLCVVFYILSTGFILVAYFYFVIRRKMKISACCNELV